MAYTHTTHLLAYARHEEIRVCPRLNASNQLRVARAIVPPRKTRHRHLIVPRYKRELHACASYRPLPAPSIPQKNAREYRGRVIVKRRETIARIKIARWRRCPAGGDKLIGGEGARRGEWNRLPPATISPRPTGPYRVRGPSD